MLKTTPNFALSTPPPVKIMGGGRDLNTNCWSFTYYRTSEIHLIAIQRVAAEHGGLIKKTIEIANALQLEAAQRHACPHPLYIRRHAKFEVAQPIRCHIMAFLLLIHYFTPWPWPLTFDLWPLTLNVCNVSPVAWWISVANLNAMERSAAELLRFQCLTLWFEHCVRVAITFTKFDLWQLIRSWIIAFFLRLIPYVTLWPSPLTRWSWKFLVHHALRDQSLYKVWAKSINPWLNYW